MLDLAREIRDGVEARVARRGDGFELAELAQELLADPAAAAAMGEAGRRFGERTLDWSRSVDGLEAFYRETLEAAAAGARRAA